MSRRTVSYVTFGAIAIANMNAMIIGDGRQIDWNAVDRSYYSGSVKATLTANAAADATTLTVSALKDAIPAGTLLDFGGKKLARTTATAAKGAVSITVSALGVAIASGDAAYYIPVESRKEIRGLTIMAVLASGSMVPRAQVADPNDVKEIGLLVAFAAEVGYGDRKDNGESNLSGEGIYYGGQVYSNILPDAGNANFATYLAELKAFGPWTYLTYTNSITG